MENYAQYWSPGKQEYSTSIADECPQTKYCSSSQDSIMAIKTSLELLSDYRFAPVPPEVLSIPEHLEISHEIQQIVIEAYSDQYVYRKEIIEELSNILEQPEPGNSSSCVDTAQLDANKIHQNTTAESSRSDGLPELRRYSQHQQNQPTPLVNVYQLEEPKIQIDLIQSKQRVQDCVACGDSFQESFILSLPCAHHYCCPCFQQLVTIACKNLDDFPPKCCQMEVPSHLIHHHTTNRPKSRMRFWIRDSNEKYLLPASLRSKYTLLVLEKSIPPEERWHCPSPKCNHVFDRRTTTAKHNAASPALRCPACHTRICTVCRTGRARRSGAHTCADHALVATLAEARRQGWQRCPSCRAVIELRHGCRHVRCRCGTEFCYVCARKWRFPYGCVDSGACAEALEVLRSQWSPGAEERAEAELQAEAGALEGGGEDAALQLAIAASIQTEARRVRDAVIAREQRRRERSADITDRFAALRKELASLQAEQRALMVARHALGAGEEDARDAEKDHRWLTEMARKREAVLARDEALFRGDADLDLAEYRAFPDVWI